VGQEAVRQLADPRSGLPVLAAGAAYRLGRLAGLGLAAGKGAQSGRVLWGASYALGLSGEAAVFEGTHRLLAPPAAGSWHWEGAEGLKDGLFSSWITFGLLRVSGGLAAGKNLLLAHFFQDSTALLGQDVAARLGFLPRPDQNWFQRMAGMEIMNLQMQASLGFFARIAPGLRSRELALDLRLEAAAKPSGIERFQTAGSSEKLEAMAARSEGDEISQVRKVVWNRNHLEMPTWSSAEEATDFLSWIRGKGEGKYERQAQVVEDAIKVWMDPEHQGAHDFEISKRIVDTLWGVQVIREVYGLEGMALEQFEKNFGLWDMLGQSRHHQLRIGPSGQEPQSIHYPESLRLRKESLEIALSVAGGALERSSDWEGLLATQPDPNSVNFFWFYQALHFAKEVGAKVCFKPASSLLDPFAQTAEVLEGGTLSRAVLRMREQGLGPESEYVLEMVIPHGEVVFGAEGAETRKAYLSAFVKDIEGISKGAWKLIDSNSPLEAPILMRVPSVSLFQEVLRQIYPDDASTFFFMDGEAGRDAMMKARELGLGVVGMGFQPLLLGDIGVKAPPWIYMFHDIFHAIMASQTSLAFKAYVATQYRSLKGKNWAQNPIGRKYEDMLIDMNFTELGFFRQSMAFIPADLARKAKAGTIQKEDFVAAMHFLDSYAAQTLAGPKSVDPAYRLGLMQAQKHTMEQVASLHRTYRLLGVTGLKVRLALTRN